MIYFQIKVIDEKEELIYAEIDDYLVEAMYHFFKHRNIIEFQNNYTYYKTNKHSSSIKFEKIELISLQKILSEDEAKCMFKKESQIM